MLYTPQIIFLFLCISHFSLPADSTSHNNGKSEGIQIAPRYTELSSDTINNKSAQQHGEPGKQNKPSNQPQPFSVEEIEEMEFIFESSPREAREIIDHLQDPTHFCSNDDYRSSFFVGEPGSGKTMMAKAIAYKMTKEKGWISKFISSTSFLGEYRNQTATRLAKELESIKASNKPTIIIIDELHQLLENADSKHHDTDTTSKELWTFLDKQKGNENFFLIGTMNRINKLPQALKSRIVSDFIVFPAITDSATKNLIIRRNLTSTSSHIAEDVSDMFLNKELEKLGSCSGRDLKKISNEIYRINKRTDPKNSSVIVIKKASIEQAINAHIARKKIIQYDVEEETDDERQNRYHKENLEMHERHFAQQQLLHMHTSYYQSKEMSINNLITLESLLSDEQINLYQQIMANTRARKAQEAANEIAAEKAAKEAAAENSLLNKAFGIKW